MFSPSQSSEKSKKVFESVKIQNEKKKLNLKAVLIIGNYTELIGYENPYPENNAVLKQHILENFNYFCKTCNYITYTSTLASGVSYDETTFANVTPLRVDRAIRIGRSYSCYGLGM